MMLASVRVENWTLHGIISTDSWLACLLHSELTGSEGKLAHHADRLLVSDYGARVLPSRSRCGLPTLRWGDRLIR